jgi:hypothetical protein
MQPFERAFELYGAARRAKGLIRPFAARRWATPLYLILRKRK